jgi:hypothetical protein
MMDPLESSVKAAASSRHTHLGLWLFLPVFIFGAMRFGLQRVVDRSDVRLPPPLQIATDPDTFLHSMMTIGGAVLLLLLVVWGLWHWVKGHPTRQPWLRRGVLLIWGLLWLLGTAQTVYTHINRTQVRDSRTITLPVMGTQMVAATTRAVGGLRMYLDWPEQGGLHTFMIETPTEDVLRRPSTLTLTIVPGRWEGWFVQAWRADVVMGDPPHRAP